MTQRLNRFEAVTPTLTLNITLPRPHAQAAMDEYADCFIDAEKLPEAEIRSALAVVTGSLGLSFPRTADAMRRAVKVAKGAGVTVSAHQYVANANHVEAALYRGSLRRGQSTVQVLFEC